MTGRRLPGPLSDALLRGLLLASLLLVTSAPAHLSASTPTTRLNAAGLVIKHGDGSVLYYYVPFSDAEVGGTDLLQRVGLDIDVAPFAGLGQAVCRIGGEGCPSSNCWCKSYSNPSFYWRYEKLGADGRWVALPYAASKPSVHDGDVIGFSWSSQDGDLPNVTLQQIAAMNGIALAPTPKPETQPATVPPATTAVATPTARATSNGTAAVVGVEVKPSGTITPVNTHATTNGAGGRSYAWFGAGIVLIALLGVVVVSRRRRSRP